MLPEKGTTGFKDGNRVVQKEEMPKDAYITLFRQMFDVLEPSYLMCDLQIRNVRNAESRASFQTYKSERAF